MQRQQQQKSDSGKNILSFAVGPSWTEAEYVKVLYKPTNLKLKMELVRT